MITSHRDAGRNTWAVAYAGLCLLMVVVGWTSVMVIVPAVQAGAPKASSAAADLSASPTPSLGSKAVAAGSEKAAVGVALARS